MPVRRVVLDSSVIVSAFRSRRGAANVVPEQRPVSRLSLPEIDAVLGSLAAAIVPVEVRFTWRPQLPDPDDEMVLEAAVNGQADALVTHSISHFIMVAPKFGLAVMPPAELLRSFR